MRLPNVRLVAPTAFVVLALIAPGTEARAQQLLADGERSLDAKEIRGDDKIAFSKLRDGNIDFKPEHRAALEKAAQWYVYRVTWPQYQKKTLPDSSDRQTLSDVVNDAIRQIPDKTKLHPRGESRDRQLKYVEEFGKEITKAVEEVLKNPYPIARVNAARILAHLGKTGPEEVGDPLVKILNDPDQIDAVKFYALRGLKELLQSVETFKDPVREAKYLNAIIGFLHREPNVPMTAPVEELEAFRYLRHEAGRALASERAPILVIRKKVVAMPALELLRIVSKQGFAPEPSLAERIDAAVGLCEMQTQLSPKTSLYQPDYAALHVGTFILDFANEYNNDRKNPGSLRLEPWKVRAVRLQQALEVMKTDAKGKKIVDAIATQAQSVLKSVEKDEVPSTNKLRGMLKTLKPESTSLYKGEEKATVDLPPS